MTNHTTPAVVVPLRNTATRQEWAGVLTSIWQKAASAFIETGRGLIAAKAELDHGEYLAMIENDLPFGRSAAHKLTTIAENRVFSNVDYNLHLPASWPTLYELALFPDDILIAKIEDGTINPKIICKEVIALRKSLLPPQTQASIMTVTQAARLAEINGKKVSVRKVTGPKIAVPDGFSTLLSAARAGVELEKEGGHAKEALARSRLSKQTYSVLRDLVLLQEITDLSKDDRARVDRAEKHVEATSHVTGIADLIKPVANKVWGIKGHRHKTDKNRNEKFGGSVSFLVSVCTSTAEIEIPHLGEERKKDAMASVEEAIASLKALHARIRRLS